ncbi:hypothetical protein [Brevibacillus sedimenti]|uniref:hypothetical protein n=1 Tax=Brevibacillus sedimenti TaxID=2613334 RepID=UPI001E5DABFA|nr:hypothetical protein [Anoxybacillus sediminis]
MAVNTEGDIFAKGGSFSFRRTWVNYIPAVTVAVKHLPRAEDNYLGWSGTYGYAIPYDDRGRENRSPYASADVVIVRYLCDKLDEDDTINMITHEFGHVLGLAHIDSRKIDSIMDYADVFDWDIDGPTSYDKKNIRELYGR